MQETTFSPPRVSETTLALVDGGLRAARVGMNIPDLMKSTLEDDATFEEIVVPVTALNFDGDQIRVEGRSLNFGVEARKRTYKAITAPAEYLGGLSPQTQSVVLSDILRRGDWGKQVNVAVQRNEVYTLCRGNLIRLRKHEVIAAAIDALGENGQTLTPTRIGTEGDVLDIEFATPRKSVDVQRGDTVQAGFHIFHSIFGEQATVVEMFTFRLVCTNGMIHRNCPAQSGVGRTRKLSVHHPNGRELQMEQVRRLTKQAWESLEPILSELQATRERKADVEGLLTGWLHRARISTEAMMPRLREAWQQDGGENTQYGAINALTRVATHGDRLSARQRRVLSSLAGLLAFSNVHICPRCFTVLSQGTTRGEDS
jgi:Domain of unknown function (DUF932)